MILYHVNNCVNYAFIDLLWLYGALHFGWLCVECKLNIDVHLKIIHILPIWCKPYSILGLMNQFVYNRIFKSLWCFLSLLWQNPFSHFLTQLKLLSDLRLCCLLLCQFDDVFTIPQTPFAALPTVAYRRELTLVQFNLEANKLCDEPMHPSPITLAENSKRWASLKQFKL